MGLLLVVGFLICSSGCRHKPAPVPPPQPILGPAERTFERDAVHLSLHADPNLNFYQEEPHTLHVCVYQLQNPNTFNQLASNEQGISQLLECTLFDSSVVGSKTLTVSPGQNLELTLDRAEEAAYVALVTGYYHIRENQVVRLFTIPEIERQKESVRYLALDHVYVDLTLGPRQIEGSE